jgi:hypothetical protein
MYSKVANFILSNKHNTALPGEKHQVIFLPDGTYNPAVFSGPGTNLEVRLKRGDEPLSAVDKMAQAHDIRYLLANTEDDVVKADETMIEKLNDVRSKGLDSNFNINQAELIRLKYYANKLGVPTSFFTTFGHGDSQAEQDLIPIAEKKLQDLEQEGYGKVRPRRLYKDDKGYYNKHSNDGVKQYLKTGSIKNSGRDLYIINMNNPKAVPKPRTAKGDDKKDKLTKMIPSPSANDIKTSGSSSNTGLPSSKQEVINAYNEGMNRNPLLDQYVVLLNQYKQQEKELAVADEKDKPTIKKKMELTANNIAIQQQQLTDEEKQQAIWENMSNYSEDISKSNNLNRILPPAPAEYRGESIAGIGTNNASSVSEDGGASISSFNASSDMGSSFNPGSSSSGSSSSGSSSSGLSSSGDAGSVQADSEIDQPVIEPVIETESLMPLDNTPDFDSVSKIEEELNIKLMDSKEEPSVLLESKNGDNSGYKRIMDEFNRLEVIQKEAEKLYAERRKTPRYSNIKPFKLTDKPDDTFSEDKATRTIPSGFTHFSQIKTFSRKIKILIGEGDLTPSNNDFLKQKLVDIETSGRISKKTLSSLDRETINNLWNEYSSSVRKQDQKDILDKYLNQEGFGMLDIDKDGLTTSHIEEMMKKYDHINLAVIASDEILTLKKGLSRTTKLIPFIMNLDPSDKPGSHWVAVIIDNKDKYVGYFDSLCIHPTSQILDDIKELVKTVDPVHMFKFKFNTVRDQSKTSGKCGMYSMMFLHNILNGMSFKKASGYYDRDYENGEHKLMNGFGFL